MSVGGAKGGRAGTPSGSTRMTHMYGPAVRCKRFSSIRQIWSCINVSGLWLERVVLPGHHGYQRACDLISGQASTGPLGSPVFACAGKTDLHRRLILSQTLAGKLTRSSIAPHLAFAVPLFVPGGGSFVPACACRRAAHRGRQGWPWRWPSPSLRCCQAALDGAEHGARITPDGMPSHRS
jgi:hypothetical protein